MNLRKTPLSSGASEPRHITKADGSPSVRPVTVPKLLVSVRDVDEARSARRGGADIIDLKEPRNGSLGAVDQQVVTEVAAEFERLTVDQPRLSLAMGELSQHEYRAFEPVWAILGESFSFAKTGLAHALRLDDWRADWRAWSDLCPSAVNPVVVGYADWKRSGAPCLAEVLQFATRVADEGRAAGVLIDTWEKNGRTLFDVISVEEIDWCIRTAHEAGLWVALAGSIDPQTVADASVMVPDIIAIRGAACGGNRDGRVRAKTVEELMKTSTARFANR